MAKRNQIENLFYIFKSAGKEGVNKEFIAQELKISVQSVPVYLFHLRKQYGVKLGSIKQDKKVIKYFLESNTSFPKDYVLTEEDSETRVYRNKFAKAKIEKAKEIASTKKELTEEEEMELESKYIIGKKGSIPVLDADLEISKISDKDFMDIRASVGLDSYGSFAQYNE